MRRMDAANLWELVMKMTKRIERAGATRRAMLWAAAAFAATLLAPALAQAVEVRDICRLKGAESSKLIGMGLVVGLKGTGDGGKFMPAMRPLAAVVQQLIDPTTVAEELKDAKNVALVSVTATLPSGGVREGDHVDVHVSAIGAAKSLQGGRLFMIPLVGPTRGAGVFAYAEGPVTIEDENTPTVGVVPDGAQLTRNVTARYFDSQGRLTLVLNNEVANWTVASNLANLINGVVAPDGPNVARAVDEKNVVVEVPAYEMQDPAGFISQIMQSYVDPAHIGTGARVVINERTGTIIISGDVQISPVIISHQGLSITTVTPEPAPNPDQPRVAQENFAAIDPGSRGGPRLADLVRAFNQLKVDAEDRIAIIKEIHRSGKLHAQLIVNE